MSVLIKGMKMPKSGYVDVRILAEGHANIAVAYKPFYEELPVIEIPPHGRLIDADALDNSLGISDEDIDFHHMLEDAPTVIGAEEGT